MRLDPDDVARARERIAPYLRPTPLRRSFAVASPATYLKLECWQPTGSFKVRGAVNHLKALPPEARARGIVAASAGNHALGVAFAVQALGGGIHATLVVPESAPRAKVEKLRSFPVTVIEKGATYDEAHAEALLVAERTGARYLHAYEDRLTASGQGTIGLEILEELPDVGAIVVPVGGGGLISAIAVAVKAVRPEVRIVAVQPEASPSLRESIRQGRALHEYPAGPTLADGIAGGVGDIAFDHRDLIDEIVEVGEPEIEEALTALVARDQVIAEASGAVVVAALRSGRTGPLQARPAVAVVSGANIDARVLARILSSRA
ncbi:MAG TPA: threonine/serine dehydratase [Vicinamibacteria bacterium]|nr:threonine/serine dehydratase [Vicinamibacteria bacterium]